MSVPHVAIIFDCDGVIFDSNALKTEAFRNILSSYPQEIVDAFIQYHKTNGGISRYVKLATFFTDFLNTPVKDNELQGLLNNFSIACQSLYKQAQLTPACLPALKALSSTASFYIASGSDETELRQVFASRHLDGYFSGIYGSPKTKPACISTIVKDIKAQTRIFFVGDAESDWQAANNADIPFIFMSKFSEVKDIMLARAQLENFSVIDTLEDLPTLISHLI